MARTSGELWPGQAAEEAAREAARADGAPPPGGYRPSAYQDQYLAGAALEPFVYPLPRPGGGTPRTTPVAQAPSAPLDRTHTSSGSLFSVPARSGAQVPAGEESRRGASAGPGATPVSTQVTTGAGPADDLDDLTDLARAGAERTDELGDEDAVLDDEQPRRRGRTAALVGGLLAIVAAGAGVFAYSALGGGGPQPETALPSTTVAFVKVDLDPSAGQKVDAVRFLRAFPSARGTITEKSDLRAVAFGALQQQGELKGIDFATDVAPWLGQRLAVGVVPAASSNGQPTVVLALAVTDPQAARAHVPSLATALGGACEVGEEFAVCTSGKDGSALDDVLAATSRGSLADAATFREDMGDLGENGIVAGWVDSAKAAGLARSLPLLSGPGLGGTSLGGTVLGGVSGTLAPASGTLAPASGTSPAPYADAGRTAVALRFDGPHLELAGHTNGAKAAFVGSKHVTGVTSLPWDSLAAVSVANGGDQLRAAWPDLEQSLSGVLAADAPRPGATATGATATGAKPGAKPGATATGAKPAAAAAGPLAAVQQLLGVTVPEDLYAALGSQFTVVFGGVEERNGDLKAAIVGNGDQVVLGKLAASGRRLGADQLTLLPSPGRSVLATSDEYGQEVVKGSGLGAMPGFQDAVKDVEDARAVAYVDIAGLVAQFKNQLDPKDTAELANLSALGVTVSGEGHSADFRIRLTTK